jgi:putative tricarboxylic transport membrane protein
MDTLAIVIHTLFGTWAIAAALVGVAVGIIGGALPGLSPSITMSLVLPFTFTMDPVSAIILLGATYVGAEYGGSIPAILIRTPGTNSAAVTAIDGYEMNKRGQGPEALGLSLVAGTIGGLVGMLALILFSQPLAKLAMNFTPAAYFSVSVLGLSVIASLTGASLLRGIFSALIGLMVATIGTDSISGVQRFTFGQADLSGGLAPVLVMMGAFAVAEMMAQSRDVGWTRTDTRMRIKLPSLSMLWRCRIAMTIGSGVGIVEGLTPGGGSSIASFISYNEAKRWSKHPEEFGKGSPEAVAGPEAANNTVAAASLIPALSLGIPGSNSSAVLLGGLLLHGLSPGPMLFQRHGDFVWGLYSGLIVANIAQILVGFVMLLPCLWLVNRPRHWIIASVIALVLSGVYSINGSIFDLWIVAVVGAGAYLFRLLDIPLLPMILGVVLGYMFEANMRRALLLSDGDVTTFVSDPLSAVFLLLSALIIVFGALRSFRKTDAPCDTA